VAIKVLLEGLLVAVVGAGLALAANAVSPRGLKLARDYFPAASRTAPSNPVSAAAAPSPAHAPDGNQAVNTHEAIAAALKELGLHLADGDLALRLFQDPGRLSGQVLFLDARAEGEYSAGHIPGSVQIDFYYIDRYLETVLPACLAAEKIVVYCNGGDCEDSKKTAAFLRDAGIPTDKLYVYVGGMVEWNRSGHPVETGARNSGQLLTPRGADAPPAPATGP
jgi:rhodanese-related sulfurtransferase